MVQVPIWDEHELFTAIVPGFRVDTGYLMIKFTSIGPGLSMDTGYLVVGYRTIGCTTSASTSLYQLIRPFLVHHMRMVVQGMLVHHIYMVLIHCIYMVVPVHYIYMVVPVHYIYMVVLIHCIYMVVPVHYIYMVVPVHYMYCGARHANTYLYRYGCTWHTSTLHNIKHMVVRGMPVHFMYMVAHDTPVQTMNMVAQRSIVHCTYYKVYGRTWHWCILHVITCEYRPLLSLNYYFRNHLFIFWEGTLRVLYNWLFMSFKVIYGNVLCTIPT